jgi:hypothetical protein
MNTMRTLHFTSLALIAALSSACAAPVDIADQDDAEETIAVDQQAVGAAPLVYGTIYHLQNGYSGWSGGYLDTRGAGCADNALCVSTSWSDNRDTKSGSWRLISADGKAYGEPVRSGDRVYLANMYPRNYSGDSNLEPGVFGGFLDTRGRGCADNKLCVSTSWSHNRDSGSGRWIIEASTSEVTEGQAIHLRNDYSGGGGYLDTRGRGCADNMLCVSTSDSADRDSGSGWWRMQFAEAGPVPPRRSDLTLDSIRSYVEQYAPIIVLHPDDPYRPDSVDNYLQNSALHGALVFNEGDYDNLQIRNEAWYSSPSMRYWGIAALEAGLKGYLSNDANVKLWLSPDTNQDEVRRGNIDRAKSYVAIQNKPGFVRIQYWYFYPYNGPGRFEVCMSSHLCEQYQIDTIGRHEGDWEHVDVDILPSGAVSDVRLSRHGDDVSARNQVAWEGAHPVVYSAFHSHAHYPSAGTQYYMRPWSTDYFFGTASVDLYDRTANGPRWASALPGKYEIVAVHDVPGVDVAKPDWAKFAGRWGGYERLRHTHSVNYGFGTYDYTQTEVGAGPGTPQF